MKKMDRASATSRLTYYACRDCGRRYDNINWLKMHQTALNHSSYKNYPHNHRKPELGHGTEEEQGFGKPSGVAHDIDGSVNYSCPTSGCMLGFPDELKLDNHQMAARHGIYQTLPRKGPPFVCRHPGCKITPLTTEIWKLHMKLVHNYEDLVWMPGKKTVRLQCPFMGCPEFETMSEYMEHLRCVHSDVSPSPVLRPPETQGAKEAPNVDETTRQSSLVGTGGSIEKSETRPEANGGSACQIEGYEEMLIDLEDCMVHETSVHKPDHHSKDDVYLYPHERRTRTTVDPMPFHVHMQQENGSTIDALPVPQTSSQGQNNPKPFVASYTKEPLPNQNPSETLSNAPSATPAKSPSNASSENVHCIDGIQEFHNSEAQTALLNDKTHPSRLLDTCRLCNKTFICAEDLAAHVMSRLHNPHNPPTSDLVCVRSGCGQRFGSAAAAISHLENGFCSKDIDRNVINRIIIENDTAGVISSPSTRRAIITRGTSMSAPSMVQHIDIDSEDRRTVARQVPSLASPSRFGMSRLGYYDTDITEDEFSPTVLTPSSSVGFSLASTCTNRAWTPISTPGSAHPYGAPTRTNANALDLVKLTSELSLVAAKQHPNSMHKCPLCSAESRRVFLPNALEAHLRSVAHAPKIFHCPASILGPDARRRPWEGHMRKFSTLSGLLQHLESEACIGGKASVEKVRKFVGEKLKELEVGLRLVLGPSGCGGTGM